MDGTGGYYAEGNKSISERQLSYDLLDMRNLRGSVGVLVVGKEKMKPDGTGSETNPPNNFVRLLISQTN